MMNLMNCANVNSDEIITGFVPHGLNHNTFKPLDKKDPLYVSYERKKNKQMMLIL
jgi:hypothetical protein